MMKSAKLEWALNNLDAALELLVEAIKVYPDFSKLVMMKGQIEEQLNQLDEAYLTYNTGVINHFYYRNYIFKLHTILQCKFYFS